VVRWLADQGLALLGIMGIFLALGALAAMLRGVGQEQRTWAGT
jgi:hypothetical protein